MGKIVIAAFKPKPGMEDELKKVISDRLPLLRSLGLATDRANITMRSQNGTFIDVSEWTDEDAIAKAHQTPEVHALWQRFEACSDFVRLETLDEIQQDFATFDAIATRPS